MLPCLHNYFRILSYHLQFMDLHPVTYSVPCLIENIHHTPDWMPENNRCQGLLPRRAQWKIFVLSRALLGLHRKYRYIFIARQSVNTVYFAVGRFCFSSCIVAMVHHQHIYLLFVCMLCNIFFILDIVTRLCFLRSCLFSVTLRWACATHFTTFDDAFSPRIKVEASTDAA